MGEDRRPDAVSAESSQVREENQAVRKSYEGANIPPEAQTSSEAKPSHKSTPARFACRAWCLIVDQWFLISMGILIAFASQVQVPNAQQDIKQTVVGYLAVAIIFFINGCTLPTQVLLENLSRWKLHVFTQVQCYLLTSAISYGVVSACATNEHFMDPSLLVGIILVGSLPTAISFNAIMAKKANGNDALAITQSTIGNLLGPFLTTALLELYTSPNVWYANMLPETDGVAKTYQHVFKQLGLSVFVPLAAGQTVNNSFPQVVKKVLGEWKLSKLSSFAILTIIWSTYDGAFESKAFAHVRPDNMIFVVFILIALFLLWFAIALITSRLWLSREDTIAVAYLVPTKAPAMGVPLVTIMFAGLSEAAQTRMQLPMVIYQGIQTSLCGVFTIFLRKWQASENAPDAECARGRSRGVRHSSSVSTLG
ncbi:SBF-like CPA transporter family-domain-containing protein [Aspergillus avenaceus]|uniref:SBF-like CPA transporter family-domain-containing protein n=1 Tax=Aspergillus avenaceus TaxID=36643 RepID=A0A5N6TIV1_ASPAV|nr:SBF-like CPA transporter family-domain-containing protein [Aspergillus avenaceus]